MDDNLVVIVIPVYKKVADENETQSITQCLKILPSYPYVFLCPNSLDTTFYSDLCKKHNISNFSFLHFDDSYFGGKHDYDKLLLTGKFYRKFKRYEFMFIYQPDAWVFRDELKEWCARNFDFIGAPWFVGQDISTPDSGFLEYAGNGGFSLRKIHPILKVISTYKVTLPPAEIWKQYEHFNWPRRLIRLPWIVIRMLGWKNNSMHFRSLYHPYDEDNYWAFFANKLQPGFRPATWQEAVPFAFELHPEKMYELNNHQLPFGCHAWEKWGLEFWKPFMQLP